LTPNPKLHQTGAAARLFRVHGSPASPAAERGRSRHLPSTTPTRVPDPAPVTDGTIHHPPRLARWSLHPAISAPWRPVILLVPRRRYRALSGPSTLLHDGNGVSRSNGNAFPPHEGASRNLAGLVVPDRVPARVGLPNRPRRCPFSRQDRRQRDTDPIPAYPARGILVSLPGTATATPVRGAALGRAFFVDGGAGRIDDAGDGLTGAAGIGSTAQSLGQPSRPRGRGTTQRTLLLAA
jgi:hypothetical protein